MVHHTINILGEERAYMVSVDNPNLEIRKLNDSQNCPFIIAGNCTKTTVIRDPTIAMVKCLRPCLSIPSLFSTYATKKKMKKIGKNFVNTESAKVTPPKK